MRARVILMLALAAFVVVAVATIVKQANVVAPATPDVAVSVIPLANRVPETPPIPATATSSAPARTTTPKAVKQDAPSMTAEPKAPGHKSAARRIVGCASVRCRLCALVLSRFRRAVLRNADSTRIAA